MWCKNNFSFPAFLLCFCAVQAQAGLFGISFKDRQEFVDAREPITAAITARPS